MRFLKIPLKHLFDYLTILSLPKSYKDYVKVYLRLDDMICNPDYYKPSEFVSDFCKIEFGLFADKLYLYRWFIKLVEHKKILKVIGISEEQMLMKVGVITGHNGRLDAFNNMQESVRLSLCKWFEFFKSVKNTDYFKMFKLEVLRKQNSMLSNRMDTVDEAWLEFFVYVFCYERFTKNGKFLNAENLNFSNAIQDIENFVKDASTTNMPFREFVKSQLVYFLAKRFKRKIIDDYLISKI